MGHLRGIYGCLWRIYRAFTGYLQGHLQGICRAFTGHLPNIYGAFTGHLCSIYGAFTGHLRGVDGHLRGIYGTIKGYFLVLFDTFCHFLVLFGNSVIF